MPAPRNLSKKKREAWTGPSLEGPYGRGGIAFSRHEKGPGARRGPSQFPLFRRTSYIGLGWMMAKEAPCGSENTANRPVPGISVGGTWTCAPRPFALAATASQSVTAK